METLEDSQSIQKPEESKFDDINDTNADTTTKRVDQSYPDQKEGEQNIGQTTEIFSSKIEADVVQQEQSLFDK